MLRAAKQLEGQRDRPFAAAQGDKKEPSHSTTCNLCSYARPPSPYGILELYLRLMLIGADKSAVGTINRPLHCPYALFPTTNSYTRSSLRVEATENIVVMLVLWIDQRRWI